MVRGEMSWAIELARVLARLRAAETEDDLSRTIVRAIRSLLAPHACSLSRWTTRRARRDRPAGETHRITPRIGRPWRLVIEWRGGEGAPDGSDEILAELLRQTAEALERLRANGDQSRSIAIDDVPESVIIARADGTFVLNEAAVALIGESPTAVDPWSIDVRRRSGMVCGAEDRPLRRALLCDETTLGRELAVVGRSGELIPVTVTAFPHRRREAVEIIRRAPAGDVDRRVLDERAAVVAHELRGAATSLSFIRQALERDEPVRADRMTRAIARITRLAGVLVGEDELASPVGHDLVDLARMVAEETGDDRSIDRSRHIETDLGEGIPAVAGDGVALRQVVTNLLDNAVKYGNPTSPIGVSVSALLGWVVVEVRSRGACVEREDLPFVFHRYFRGARRAVDDAAAKRSQGLGLDVCKRIVEAHGGTIGFESHDGVTTVRFSIPASPAAVALQRISADSAVGNV